MEIFKLFGSIFVNTEDAENSIQKTTDKAEGFASKLGDGIATAAKWGTAIVAGATAAGTAMVAFASKSAETADNIDKMSQKIGISREAYQELDFICSQSGMSVDSLQAGMKALTAAMDGAASGTASNVEEFEKLGISVTNADGSLRSQEDVMWETMAALQKMTNQTEKARLATQLFGRSGTELMPLLNGQTGSLEEMKNQAHELGLVMSDELIDNGVELTDSLDQTKRAFGAIVTQLGASLMPIVTRLSEYIQAALPSIQQLVEGFAPILTGILESILPPLMDMAETIFPVLFDLLEQLLPSIAEIAETILPIIVEFIQMIIPPIMEIVQALLPVLMQLIEALLPILQVLMTLLQPIIELFTALLQPILSLITSALTPLIEIFGKFISEALQVAQPLIETLSSTVETWLGPVFEALSPVFAEVIEALQPLFDLFSDVWELVVDSLIPAMEALAEVLSGVLFQAIESIMTILEPLFDVLGGLIDFITGVFTGDWEKAWNGIVDVFKGIINLIPAAVEGIINLVIALINGIIWGINKVTGLIGIPEIPEIPTVSLPRLEEGGILEQGEVGLLEGNGAEAVVPLDKNQKWISAVADDMEQQGIGGGTETVSLLKSMLEEVKSMNTAIDELKQKQVYLDSGVLVGELSPAIDDMLGTYALRAERGVV